MTSESPIGGVLPTTCDYLVIGGVLPTTCDYLVIGGGAVGMSVAYGLAKSGAGSVVLLDRRMFGTGASNKSGGGFRRIHLDRFGAHTTLRSFEVLASLEAELGCGPLLRRNGYLYLFSTPQHEELGRRALGFVEERAPGTASILSLDETADLFPWIDQDGLSSTLWSPEDGYLKPLELLDALAHGVRLHGAQAFQGVRVESLDVTDGAVTTVRTSAGSISAGTVVLAASAGSSDIARTAGVELAHQPFVAQRFLMAEAPPANREYPWTVDVEAGFTMRGDDGGEGGAMVGFADLGRPAAPTGPDVDWGQIERNMDTVLKRLPTFAGYPITGAVRGILDAAEDLFPLIGYDDEVANLMICCGFAGSGVMHSLGIGEAVAELITTGECTTIDLQHVNANRYSRGEGNPVRELF